MDLEPKTQGNWTRGHLLGVNLKSKLEVGLTNCFDKKFSTPQIETQLTESSILSTFKGYVVCYPRGGRELTIGHVLERVTLQIARDWI